MFVLSSLAVLLAGQITSAPPASAPVLQVGVFSYGPDGKEQAAAYATTLDSESFQYIAGCEIGGGNRPVPDRATDAWRLSGKVETLTAEEAVVRIDWQRIRAGEGRGNFTWRICPADAASRRSSTTRFGKSRCHGRLRREDDWIRSTIWSATGVHGRTEADRSANRRR